MIVSTHNDTIKNMYNNNNKNKNGEIIFFVFFTGYVMQNIERLQMSSFIAPGTMYSSILISIKVKTRK